MPPCYGSRGLAHTGHRHSTPVMVTSSDDFVQSETLALATSLARNGRDFELHDFKVPPTQTLGHVFPVGMTWLPESERVLHGIRAFSYPLAQ